MKIKIDASKNLSTNLATIHFSVLETDVDHKIKETKIEKFEIIVNQIGAYKITNTNQNMVNKDRPVLNAFNQDAEHLSFDIVNQCRLV